MIRPNLFEISVSDTGLGIRKEDQEKLLLDFSRISNSEDRILNNYGVGLGLSISDALAKELSGEKKGLILKSDWGKGSTFSFFLKDFNETDLKYREFDSLPRIPNMNESLDWDQCTSRNISKSIKSARTSYTNLKRPIASLDFLSCHELNVERKKCDCRNILICDDNHFNIISIRLQLQHLGRECDAASLGDIALQKVREKLKSSCCRYYKLIFMDLEMPVMDGLETSKKIKEITDSLSYRTKIVAFSGYDAFEERIKALKAGMEDFLVKPVMERDLRRIIEEIPDIRKIRSEEEGIRRRDY
jgi:CheY-like chemotaxis protein